jgi:predicted transcriptional regulator
MPKTTMVNLEEPAITIRLEREVADRIVRLAREDGLTPTAFCRQAIYRHLVACKPLEGAAA